MEAWQAVGRWFGKGKYTWLPLYWQGCHPLKRVQEPIRHTACFETMFGVSEIPQHDNKYQNYLRLQGLLSLIFQLF